MKVTYKMYGILLLSLILTIPLSGCDKGSTSYDSKNKEECIEPHNPYNDGGGHDAGYNWAMEKGGDCNGRSNSFNEGCEEYFRQLNQYNECIANNSK